MNHIVQDEHYEIPQVFSYEKRWKQIAVIAFGLAIYWCFNECITIGQLKPNYWHDVICLVMAIMVDRCLPWGKKSIE